MKIPRLSLPFYLLWFITLLLLSVVAGRLYVNNRALENLITSEIEAARQDCEFAPFDLSSVRQDSLKQLGSVGQLQEEEALRLLTLRSDPVSALDRPQGALSSVLRRENRDRPVDVWVITNQEGASLAEIPDHLLAASRTRVQLFYLEDPVTFELQTGIRTIPATLLLGQEKQPLFVAFGTLDEAAAEVLVNRVGQYSGGEPHLSFPYVRSGISSELQPLSARGEAFDSLH
ncbi:MAG TPA: hypothetical protein VLU25_19680 [Acidobacteriota bacterium]|nr:hypothetical protein [Acidobacteriota bacterium]